MAKFKDTVELVLGARNEASAELRRAEMAAKDAERRQRQREKEALSQAKAQTDQRRKIQQEGYRQAEKDAGVAGKRAASAFESPLLKSALRATAAFGAMELGIGGAVAVSKALSGNLEDAAEAVKQLPVIGGFARSLEDALDIVTGIRTETEAIKRINAAMVEGQKLQSKMFEKRLELARSFTEELRKQKAELRILTAPENQVDVLKDRLELANEIEAANDRVLQAEKKVRAALREKGDTSSDQNRITEIREEIDALNNGIGNIISRQNFFESIADSGFDARVKALEDEKKALEDNIASRRDAVQLAKLELEQARTLADNAREIAEKRFERASLDRAKELEKRQAESRKRMREEEILEEKKAADERLRLYQEAVEARRRLEERHARERREEAFEENRQRREQLRERRSELMDQINRLRSFTSANIPQNTANQNRFLTGVTERSAALDRKTLDPQREMANQLKEAVKRIDDTQTKLQDIYNELKNGPRVVGGVFG